MNKLAPDKGLKLFDIKLNAYTAGPSPDNNCRTEVFLLGCNKANQGDSCPGCFNYITWDKNKALWSYDPVELAQDLNNNTPNKYITIGGGEPLDQIDNLLVLCKELKTKYNYHILMYTWRDLDYTLNNKNTTSTNNIKYPIDKDKVKTLLKYVDIIIDGEFDNTEKLYKNESHDGFYGSIGSGNQKIWDTHTMTYEYMRDIIGLKLDLKNKLIYERKNS